MRSNIIVADFSGGGRKITAAALYQYDFGQILQFSGIDDLPAAYEVHFSNDKDTGYTKTQIGSENGVAIPDEYFLTGQPIYVWLFLHAGETDGETVYQVTIPINKRSRPADYAPTAVEQSAITQAIAALNVAVESAEDAQEAAETAQGKAEDAQEGAESAQSKAEEAQAAAEAAKADVEANTLKAEGYAVGQQNGSNVSPDSPYYHNNAKYYKEQAEAVEVAAEQEIGAAKTAALSAIFDAESVAESEIDTAKAAAITAVEAAGSAQVQAVEAAGATQTAAARAQAEAAAASASSAGQAKSAAETAQGKAETAQGKAEDAQSAAETAAQSVSASAAQIAKNASDIERLNAGVDVLFDFHKTSLTWGEIVALIESGEMSEIFPVASQIKDVWKNTSDASVEFPWDIVHYSQNGDTWLKLHYAAPEALQFDAPEAIYYFDGTEPAGTYHIPIGSSYGTGWVAGHSIQFTLTAAPDEGDQLFIDCGTNYANDPADGRAWRVYDAGGTTVKQSGTTSEGTGGTSLGTIGNVNAHRTNGRLNAISRVVYGYARWSQSAMRQYFNSADVNWWTMKNPWDRPPAQASTIRGFLCGFSQDFLDHLEETEVVTALNTQEGFSETTETTLDKIFLPSLEQMYINPQLAGVEGESWDYYKALAEEAGLPGKFQQYQTYPILISYNASNTSSAVSVFLRSCNRGYAYYEWLVNYSGYVDTYFAYSASRGCPACKFKKSVQS